MGVQPTVGQEDVFASFAWSLGHYDMEMVVYNSFALARVVVTCNQELFVSKTDRG